MEIKEYGKQGLIAWSNSKSHSELLASASLQEEQGLYNIDILSLDLQERSRKINVVGNGYTDSPFRCLAWDNFGEKEGTPLPTQPPTRMASYSRGWRMGRSNCGTPTT
jgi:hypothetical protein